MARPTVMTPAIVGRFAKAIAKGASMRAAAGAAGIGKTTANRWYADDEAFRSAVDDARATRITRWLGKIETAAKKDWKAAAWLLEHCDAEEYGKSVRTSVQEEIQSFLAGLKGRLGSSAWREVLVAASEQAGPGVVRGRPDDASAEH